MRHPVYDKGRLLGYLVAEFGNGQSGTVTCIECAEEYREDWTGTRILVFEQIHQGNVGTTEECELCGKLLNG